MQFEFYKYVKLKTFEIIKFASGNMQKAYRDLYVQPTDIITFMPGNKDMYYKEYEITLRTGEKYRVEGNMFEDTCTWSHDGMMCD